MLLSGFKDRSGLYFRNQNIPNNLQNEIRHFDIEQVTRKKKQKNYQLPTNSPQEH